jgi:transcriptional regulator of acetoin/glycerol metabolism
MLEGNLFVALGCVDCIHSCVATHRISGPDHRRDRLGQGESSRANSTIRRACGKNFGVARLLCRPRDMLDSHLFGHRRGAFTGAIDTSGVIRANEGGTLFLDEIGDMSLAAQAKVLRVLQDNVVTRIGGAKQIEVDVRVLAATNKTLEAEVAEGRFREDLFYRLNVVRIPIPPLRDRREEILPFFERFLMRECARIGRPVPNLSDEAVEHLLSTRAWERATALTEVSAGRHASGGRRDHAVDAVLGHR